MSETNGNSGCKAAGAADQRDRSARNNNKQTNNERQWNMKLNGKKNSKLGIAMAEYLIILAVVAIGCVAAAGYFGQSVKSVFRRTSEALSGKVPTAATVNEDTTKSTLDSFGKDVH